MPKKPITRTEIVRSVSAEAPVIRIMVVKNNVKNVKLRINPATTPNGRFFPPVSVPDKTMGRMGSMHGERMVTIPPKNAKSKSISIRFFTLYWTRTQYL